MIQLTEENVLIHRFILIRTAIRIGETVKKEKVFRENYTHQREGSRHRHKEIRLGIRQYRRRENLYSL